MDRQCKLSDVTKDYLSMFYCILEKMIRGMTEAELTESISHNFIVQMIPHHEAAIEMSKNILKYTTNIPLQDIASRIITEQTESIEKMQNIKCFCGKVTNSSRDLCLYNRRMDQIMQNMFSRMKSAPFTNHVNCNFMWEMIPHHEGAVEMSENILQYDICPELKPILQAIIVSQRRGIRQMNQLLRCIGC